MPRNSKGRVYLNQAEMVELNDFLRTVCTSTQVGDHREAVYQSPWTDQIVANKMREKIPHIQLTHVQGFRLRVFGEIARASAGGRPTGKLTERVAELEAQVAKLTTWAKACGCETA